MYLMIVGIQWTDPANTRRWINVGLMLAQRLRRWTNIKPTMVHGIVFTGRYIQRAHWCPSVGFDYDLIIWNNRPFHFSSTYLPAVCFTVGEGAVERGAMLANEQGRGSPPNNTPPLLIEQAVVYQIVHRVISAPDLTSGQTLLCPKTPHLSADIWRWSRSKVTQSTHPPCQSVNVVFCSNNKLIAPGTCLWRRLTWYNNLHHILEVNIT